MVTLPILFIFAEHRDRDAKRGTLSALLEIRIKGRMVGELCVYFLSVDFKTTGEYERIKPTFTTTTNG